MKQLLILLLVTSTAYGQKNPHEHTNSDGSKWYDAALYIGYDIPDFFKDQHPSYNKLGKVNHLRYLSDSVNRWTITGVCMGDSTGMMTDARKQYYHIGKTGYIELITFNGDTLIIDSKYPKDIP